VAKVWKYTLTPECHIGQGYSLKPLSVGWQGDDVVLWAEATETPDVIAKMLGVKSNGLYVLVVPTGGDVPPSGFEFVGTAHGGPPSMFTGPMVMHVYARPMLDKGDESE
jgi:hypothetical protein